MNTKISILKLAAAAAMVTWATAPSSFAQLSIPSDGSDGALIIATNTVIDLSQAPTATWNTPGSGNGVYDPVQWAVVFKYTSVTIASNCTVTFLNNATHAPVVWLVQSNVTINGQVSLDGVTGVYDAVNLAEPGPGGFRGGAEGQPDSNPGVGFGPGGGESSIDENGEYGNWSKAYGTLQIVPLIGGSGGQGQYSNGGGGGGAILIAASDTVTVNGYIHANGGGTEHAYPGSGGAIRVIANQLLGAGTISTAGNGNPGRIRIEDTVTSPGLTTDPITQGVSPNIPVTIFPASTAPTATIVSIAGQTVPSDPKAAMPVSNGGDDLMMATNSTVTIMIQTANFPTNGTVNVCVKPRNYYYNGGNYATCISGNTALATWQLQQAMPVGHFVVQVRAYSN